MKDWHLTPAQRGMLERELAHTRDAGLFRRLLALLQVDQGQSVVQAARLVRANRRSVHRWMERFASEHKPSALEDHRGQGQPPNWSEDLESLVESALAQAPRELGYPANSWTVPLLQAFLSVYHPQQEVSLSTLRRRLRELGYVWKRFRYVLAPDPEAEKKTPDFAANTGFARAHRAAGGG
jgi:transposase